MGEWPAPDRWETDRQTYRDYFRQEKRLQSPALSFRDGWLGAFTENKGGMSRLTFGTRGSTLER